VNRYTPSRTTFSNNPSSEDQNTTNIYSSSTVPSTKMVSDLQGKLRNKCQIKSRNQSAINSPFNTSSPNTHQRDLSGKNHNFQEQGNDVQAISVPISGQMPNEKISPNFLTCPSNVCLSFSPSSHESSKHAHPNYAVVSSKCRNSRGRQTGSENPRKTKMESKRMKFHNSSFLSKTGLKSKINIPFNILDYFKPRTAI
ncbi:hypothetical protein ROZALSC1DRAFT_31509, partial [Rozella allomycis CSF55]